MLISKRPRLKPRTTGFYGHLPKFWSCKNYDFHGGWRKFGEEKPDWWDAHAEEQEFAHSSCWHPHMSYTGYFRYVGRKNLYTFWYTGRSPRDKILEKIERMQW